MARAPCDARELIYRRGSYRIATAPESSSSRLTSFKSTCFDSCGCGTLECWPAMRGYV
jgi:hypothetical protein